MHSMEIERSNIKIKSDRSRQEKKEQKKALPNKSFWSKFNTFLNSFNDEALDKVPRLQ